MNFFLVLFWQIVFLRPISNFFLPKYTENGSKFQILVAKMKKIVFFCQISNLRYVTEKNRVFLSNFKSALPKMEKTFLNLRCTCNKDVFTSKIINIFFRVNSHSRDCINLFRFQLNLNQLVVPFKFQFISA